MSNNVDLNNGYEYLRNRNSSKNPSARSRLTDDNAKQGLFNQSRNYPLKLSPAERLKKYRWHIVIFLAILFFVVIKTRIGIQNKIPFKNDQKFEYAPERDTFLKEQETVRKLAAEKLAKMEYEAKQKERKVEEKRKFSEEEVSYFFSEMSTVFRTARKFDTKTSYSSVEDTFEEETNFNLKDSEISLSKFEKRKKAADKLKNAVYNFRQIEESYRVEKISAVQNTKNFKKLIQSVESVKNTIKQKSEQVSKMKEERRFLIEIASNIKIQIENDVKSANKNIESKESFELERDIIRKNIEKRKKGLVSQTEHVEKLYKEITRIEKEIIKTEKLNKDNSERKKELQLKRESLSSKPKSLAAAIARLRAEIKSIEIKKFEIERTLKTIGRFNELLISLQKELKEYSQIKENSLETEYNSDQKQTIQKIKEKEDAIKRIQTFQKNALDSLKDIFINKAENFDNKEEMLEKEVISSTILLKEKKLKLANLIEEENKVVSELKSVNAKILSIGYSENESVEKKERTIKSKKEDIKNYKDLKNNIEKEINNYESKLVEQKNGIGEQNNRLVQIQTDIQTQRLNLEQKEVELYKKEDDIQKLVRETSSNLHSLRSALEDLERLRRKLGGMNEGLLELKEQFIKAKNEVESRTEQLDQLLCFGQSDDENAD